MEWVAQDSHRLKIRRENRWGAETGGVESGASDPDLAKIIAAWPSLPEPIRRAMLALVGPCFVRLVQVVLSPRIESRAMKLPRFQFTLRTIFLATLWMAVGCGGFVAGRSIPPAWEFRGPYLLWYVEMWATFYIVIASPFIAVGVLLGRAKMGAVIGILATSALIAVATLQFIYEPSFSTSERNEWLTMGTLHGLAAVAGFVILFRRHR